MTPLRLPEPRDVLLPRSPLTLVVCQVRHDRILAVADPRTALGIQKRLGGRYTQMDEWRSMAATVTLAGGGPPQVTHDQGPSGWQMKSDDGAWTVTLQPESFSLETSSYVDWADFRERLQTLTDALAEAYNPTLEVRVGLRYVDEIDDPVVTSPVGWRGHIRDELLGPLAHPEFGPSVRALMQQVDFDAGDGYRVTLRHGTNPTPGNANLTYVLDHDCYRQAARAFAASDVMSCLDDLHRVALQVFQSAITPELFRYLEGVE